MSKKDPCCRRDEAVDEADPWAALPSIGTTKPGEPIDIFFLPTEDPDRIGSDELSLMFTPIEPQSVWSSQRGVFMSDPAAEFVITPRRYNRHKATGTIHMSRSGWEELNRVIGEWLGKTAKDS